MNFKRLLLFLAAPLALVMHSCDTPEPEYTLPEITVTDAEGADVTAVNFTAEGGDETFTITATRNWSISSQADWLAINPLSYTNKTMASEAVEVTITAAPNEDGARNETIKISMDKTELTINIAQAGKGQVALGEVLYYDNFDKGGQAQKGSSGWDTYMDGAGAAYCNPTPENQANVAYTGTKLTVRSNSSNGSGGIHSNYEGSGVNYLWFGTAPTNFTVSGITLENLEGNALTLSFGTERYEYNAEDNTFKNDEFQVYISGDGEKWSQVEYTFLEGVNLNGKWNIATAQFNLKEVPETLSIYFTATVGAAYALDDLKLTAGGGGVEIDLANGGAIEGGSTGGGNTGSEDAVKATVAEFLAAAEDDTVYELTGEITRVVNTTYGNFDITDATGTVYVYGLLTPNGEAQKQWAAAGLKEGDTITIQGTRTSYNGDPQMKNATYVSHTSGEGGGTTDPEDPETPTPGEGTYASDSPFVCTTDDSAKACYGLASSTVCGESATGFKLGKSKQEGVFTSKAIGVSGDKYLNFYAVSWGAGGDKTIYYRVNGGEVLSQAIKANDGAAGNTPYTITVTADDHYSVLLSGLAATDVIEFSTNAAFDCATTTDYATRAIFFGVKLTDEPLSGEGGGTTEPEPETPAEVVKATVAEFLAAAEDATVYELTGEITRVVNTTYGNFDITDATGTVYVYGLLTPNGEAQKQWAAAGLKEGDTITIQGTRTSFNGDPQMKNATYVSHTSGEGGGTTEPEPEPEPEPGDGIIISTIADFLAAAEGDQLYQLTGEITNIANTTYGNIDIMDATGSVYVYGLTATQVSSNDKSFASLGLEVGDIVTLVGTRSSYNGNAQVGGPAYYISHEDAPEEEIPAGSVVAEIKFSEQGLTNAQSVVGTIFSLDSNITAEFAKGGASNDPAYYDSGAAIRMYQNGATLSIDGGGKTITSIELTFSNNHYYVGADSGELSAEASVRTWTGSASSVKFTSTGTDKNHRAYVAAIKVTYDE